MIVDLEDILDLFYFHLSKVVFSKYLLFSAG